jgi:hypothetical protein
VRVVHSREAEKDVVLGPCTVASGALTGAGAWRPRLTSGTCDAEQEHLLPAAGERLKLIHVGDAAAIQGSSHDDSHGVPSTSRS